VLLAKGFISNYRHVSGEEFEHWLKTLSICNENNEGEIEVLYLYNQAGHAFLKLQDNLVFSKASYSKHDLPKILTYESMWDDIRVRIEDYKEIKSKRYHCELDKNAVFVSPEIDFQLIKLEAEIESISFNKEWGDIQDNGTLENLFDRILKLKNNATIFLNSQKNINDKAEVFMARINTLLMQVNIWTDPDYDS
jgi:hypothetical protein